MFKVCLFIYLVEIHMVLTTQAKGEMIGQAGVSVHIMYYVFRVPTGFDKSKLKTSGLEVVSNSVTEGLLTVNDKDYMLVPHRAISDDSKQNWFHTCGELELSLEALKQEFPTINEVHMLSDGASNYDCTATLLALGEISARTNVKVRDNRCLKCHYH